MQQRFLLQILLLAQQASGTTMPIIRSSRVLHSGCCLWYFVLWFSSCWPGVELRVMCPVCRMLQQAIRSAIKTSVAASCHFISTNGQAYLKCFDLIKVRYNLLLLRSHKVDIYVIYYTYIEKKYSVPPEKFTAIYLRIYFKRFS